MVKKIVSVATAFLMLFCMIPFGVFADDVLDVCPKCGERTYSTWRDLSVEVADALGMPVSIKSKSCSNCGYAYYDWNLFGITGYKDYDNGGTSLVIDYLREWVDNTFGKNATATKFTPGGRNPKGYGDEGKADVNSNGKEILWVEPLGISATYLYGFDTSAPSSLFAASSGTGGGTSYPDSSYIKAVYYFTAPVTGLYYLGNSGNPYDFGTFSYFYDSKWQQVDFLFNFDKAFEFSRSLEKGKSIYLYISGDRGGPSKKAFKFYLNNAPVFVDPLGDSSITTTNNITINNNTWNGNIYTDNSTNLTYIYPQYTTVNEKNETVTNISNTPIIYNNETKQYYTYDQTTKNYYYITYNAPSPSPTPAPTEKPGGSISTPETGKPGGDTGDTTGILAVLVEIRDNMIQGFLDIKAAFVAGFADFSANFTLAIENLTLNIQNFFFKGMSGSPVDPNIPGGGSISTPETGGSDSSSGSGWSWNPLKWLTDLLKDIVEGIIKTIWKLITSLFGFLLWLLSLVGKLFPFIPGQAVLAVTSAVVIVAVIRIIKFITGR